MIKSRDEQGRLVLSLRELLGTWQENAGRFAVGETVVGIVRSIEDYGVFIESHLIWRALPSDRRAAAGPAGERLHQEHSAG